MNLQLKKLALAFIVFILVDTVWLTYSKKHWAKLGSGPHASKDVLPAAFLAYVALAMSIVYIGLPLVKSYGNVWIPGLLNGFVVYATFDMTNRVIFGQAYPYWLAFADTAWGMIATTVTLYVVSKLESKLFLN
jgi:uncharacterized membrane protein